MPSPLRHWPPWIVSLFSRSSYATVLCLSFFLKQPFPGYPENQISVFLFLFCNQSLQSCIRSPFVGVALRYEHTRQMWLFDALRSIFFGKGRYGCFDDSKKKIARHKTAPFAGWRVVLPIDGPKKRPVCSYLYKANRPQLTQSNHPHPLPLSSRLVLQYPSSTPHLRCDNLPFHFLVFSPSLAPIRQGRPNICLNESFAQAGRNNSMAMALIFADALLAIAMLVLMFASHVPSCVTRLPRYVFQPAPKLAH